MEIPFANFLYYMPTRLIFGVGTFNILGEEVIRLGKKALIVTYADKNVAEQTQQAVDLLNQNGIDTVVFEEVEANPPHTMINKGGEIARKEKCDVVIGIGGGSAMDTAKAIAVVATENVDIWRIVEGAPITKTNLPLVVVPTTAGTGSEVTQYAVVSNRGLHRKIGFAKPQFYPTVSIVDPLLTVSLPPTLTASIGMDVLTHAIEAYTSRVASPVSDLFAVEAIKLTAQNLRKVVQNGKDLEARKNMMLANTLAGVAITHADTCIVHVIGEVIGGMYNTGHGITMALLLPAVTEHNCVGNLEKYAHISHMMGENVEGLSLREAAMKAPGAIRNMLKDISLPQGLAAIGVKDDLTNVLPFVTAPGMTDSNPRQLGAKEFELIIKGSLSPAMSYWDLGGI